MFSLFSGEIVKTSLPNFPTKFDKNVKSLIKKCWEINPQLRPTSNDIFEWFDSNIKSFEPYNQERFQKYFQLLYGIQKNIYDNLTTANKKFIRDATFNDDESSFYVGKSFLFGKYFFPRNLDVGLFFLKKLNQKENPNSLYFTGYLYETGKINVIFKQDRKKAIEYYEKAAKMGSLASIEKLAKIYTTSNSSIDTEKKTKLIQYCQKLADSGNIEGLYILGTFYNDGFLVDQDEKHAFDCFKKASDQGHIKSMIKCGMMLRYGIGVDCNLNEALGFLSKAASLDPQEGAFQYACMLNDESTPFYNKDEAKKQFEIAAKNGHSKSIKIIKSINNQGEINEIDEDDEDDDDDMNYDIQSVYYDRMKALKGNPKSIKRFSHFIYRHPRLEPDESSQMTFFKLASDLGDPIGQLKYGEYLTKSKKKEEIEKGIQLVKASADSGNVDAINLYAFFNFNNNLNHKNLKESLKYYLKSAHMNNLTGLVNAGFILQNSEEDNDIQSDPIQAVTLFKKAAEMGNEIGLFHYGEALLTGEGVEQNFEEAVKMFKMASEKGDSDSMIELGSMYETGEGVKQDTNEALKLYRKAAEMNNSEGMVHFASLAEKFIKRTMNEEFVRKIEQTDKEKTDEDDYNEEQEKKESTEEKKERKVDKNDGFVESKNVKSEDDEDENELSRLKKLSIDYIKTAVDLDNSNAMNAYGELLLHGNGVHCDIELATKYFKMAIENDNCSAMCNYGLILETSHEHSKAKDLYERAISSDETFGSALLHIGYMKLNGHQYEVDFGAAENFFRAAIEDDCVDAPFALGWMYERGVGVGNKNSKKAFELYKEAAIDGSVFGLIGIGKLYENGFDGFEKNVDAAKSVFNYVANLDNGVEEIIFCGLCFENGEAAPKDMQYAELCFRIAADLNNENGVANYRRLIRKKNSKVNQ